MENTNQTPIIKLDFKDSKYATVRTKTSIAKVWLKKGSGQIVINGKKYDDYFTREIHKMKLLRPFEIINQPTDYDVKCNVAGGGLTGQAGAMVHGISKAILLFDLNLKSQIVSGDFTVRRISLLLYWYFFKKESKSSWLSILAKSI